MKRTTKINPNQEKENLIKKELIYSMIYMAVNICSSCLRGRRWRIEEGAKLEISWLNALIAA